MDRCKRYTPAKCNHFEASKQVHVITGIIRRNYMCGKKHRMPDSKYLHDKIHDTTRLFVRSCFSPSERSNYGAHSLLPYRLPTLILVSKKHPIPSFAWIVSSSISMNVFLTRTCNCLCSVYKALVSENHPAVETYNKNNWQSISIIVYLWHYVWNHQLVVNSWNWVGQ